MSEKKYGPPSDVEPSELFLKLTELPSPSEVVDFPRRGGDGQPLGRIRIKVLDSASISKARMAAQATMKAKGYSTEDLKSPVMVETVGDEVARELLALACRAADSNLNDAKTGHPIYGRIFRNASDVGVLSGDELTVLFYAYMQVQRKYGPLENEVDVGSWVKRLVEGGSAFPLLSLDLPTLSNVTFTLAVKMSTLLGCLESMFETLPSTCQSDLSKFRLGTGYWQQPARDLALNYLEKLAEPVTIESAAMLADTVARNVPEQY